MTARSPAHRRKDIMEEANGRWAGLLPLFGISSASLSGKHGPCPMCGGRDRFRFDDKEGNGTWICNQCGAGNGMRLLMQKTGMSFAEAAANLRQQIPAVAKGPASKPRSAVDVVLARDMWKRSVSLPGTMADKYLALRGIEGESPALRFLPACPVSGVPGVAQCDAMIALVSAPDGQFATLHKTYLAGPAKAAYRYSDGRTFSARQLMPGGIPDGAAIRLSDAHDELGVAEGIETAKSAERLFGVPCWATINSTLLKQFTPPPQVRRLVIFGDNDPKFGGQAAAFAAAHRIACRAQRPIHVEVRIPPRSGSDWNDVLMERQRG